MTTTNTPRINAAKFIRGPKGTYTAEISDLGLRERPDEFDFVISNGTVLHFVLAGCDMDASGEDVYGWKYESAGTPVLKALIIND
jgi:hypothetical protein